MTFVIWGLVLMHKPALQTLVEPSSFFVLQSDQTALPSDNANWQAQSIKSLALPDTPIWLKFTLDFDKPLKDAGASITDIDAPMSQSKDATGLLISVLGAYTVYFNEEFIGSNGQPAHADSEEIPGDIDSVFLLPPHLIQPGTNTVIMRFSSQHRPKNLSYSGVWVLADHYVRLVNINEERVRLPMMMLSALLLVSLYSFMVYFSSLKNVSYLWFSGLSVALMCLIVAESWRGLFGYTYQWHVFRMEVVLWLTLAISLLLPMFFVALFGYSKRVSLICLAIIALFCSAVMLFVGGYDYRSFILFSVGLASSFIVCVASLIAKKQHAWIMTTGLIIFVSPVLLSRYSFMDQYFFVSFIGLALLMLMVLNQTQTERQKALTQSMFTTQRLELELVKKQLQPHFILNTLTAIEEWVDTAPKEAVIFIQALAQEFRQMAQLSSQSLVTLAQELALCETHLKIMGYRFDATFTLETIDVDPQHSIPPGIILTLIENAFSHNYYDSQAYTFALSCKVNTSTADNSKKMATYTFTSKRSTLPNEHGEGHSSPSTRGLNTGVGNKYIKARLREAYSDAWEFEEIVKPDAWSVVISLPTGSEIDINQKAEL
jgi:hypothetical protein